MYNNQFDDYVRCLACGHPYFKEEHHLVLNPEPVRLHDDDYQYVAAVAKQTKYVYVCAKCGAVLDRAQAAQLAEDRRLGKNSAFVNNPPNSDSTGFNSKS